MEEDVKRVRAVKVCSPGLKDKILAFIRRRTKRGFATTGKNIQNKFKCKKAYALKHLRSLYKWNLLYKTYEEEHVFWWARERER